MTARPASRTCVEGAGARGVSHPWGLRWHDSTAHEAVHCHRGSVGCALVAAETSTCMLWRAAAPVTSGVEEIMITFIITYSRSQRKLTGQGLFSSFINYPQNSTDVNTNLRHNCHCLEGWTFHMWQLFSFLFYPKSVFHWICLHIYRMIVDSKHAKIICQCREQPDLGMHTAEVIRSV